MNNINCQDNIVQPIQSIHCAATFGIRTKFLTDNRNHAMLLEMREEITAYLWAIASNTPMVTPIEYVSMNSLCSLVEKVEEELTKQRDAYNGNAPIFTN